MLAQPAAWFAGLRPRAKWPVVFFLLFTLIGVMNFNRFFINELAEGNSPNYPHYFIAEMTGAYAVLALLPVVLHFFARFPLRRDTWRRHLPLYLLANLGFGVSHTLLMFLSRKALYPLLLGKEYDYGPLGYRLLMEYNHQFFTFWLIYAAALGVNMLRAHQRQKVRAAELQQQLTKARLEALQMQLNPHFLFNTLNLISATMYEDVAAADKMLVNLSDLLRLTLPPAAAAQHALQEELAGLQLYLNIMKARFADKLQVEFDLAAETKTALVPAFLLQPLVENAIHHGMQSLHPVIVMIQAQQEDHRLKLTVQDNGPGIAAPGQALRHGVGLSNTAERLEKLYGASHRFSLQNRASGGLQVTIEIPFCKAAEAGANHGKPAPAAGFAGTGHTSQ